MHRDEHRAPTLELRAPAGLDAADVDDSFYPALGYLCGLKSPNAVPLLTGVGHLPIGRDELKGSVPALPYILKPWLLSGCNHTRTF